MRPEQCAECQAVGSLIGHGWYHRKPKDKQRVYSIWIKRWKCQACGHTCSCLPDFLLAHRHYLVESTHQILSTRFEAARSWAEVAAACTNQGIPDLRTMQRWCRSFIEQACRWLAAVQETLAQQDSGSAWLDPHGEAPRAANPAGALLQAAIHLLAWAKTQWPELAGYGRDDRLRFLWLWGANRGLGRLV
ncbi:MAG TPA: DUF6431 domain-containing protein [Anaerolineales bacterium]